MLLVLIYFTAAGVAYLVSIIVQTGVSQLVGVLVVLGSMMFSGFVVYTQSHSLDLKI